MDVELAHILQKLVFFQRRAYNLNEYTARKKRRIVSGIRESIRHINKAKAIVFTTDIEDDVLKSIEYITLIRACKEKNVEIVWTGLRQGELGAILYNYRVLVCCVTILSADGCLDEFKTCLEQYRSLYKESIEKMKMENLYVIAAKYGVTEVFQNDLKEFDKAVLLTAATFGHADIVKKLIEHFDYPTKCLVLKEACQKADCELVCTLLDNQANFHIDDLITCTLSAIESCNKNVISRLTALIPLSEMSVGIKIQLIQKAAQSRNSIPIEFVLAKLNVDFSFLVENSANILQVTLEAGALECCKFLLKKYPQLAKHKNYDGILADKYPSILSLLSRLSLCDNSVPESSHILNCK